jgi:uncharacterized protein (DUF849 family)
MTTRKVIVSCAVTGSADTVGKNPAVPVTPDEIAASALDAAKAGAAIVHIHVRDPETGQASMELEHYRRVVGLIRDSGTDVILNLTTGYGGRFKPGEDDPLTPGPGTTLVAPELRVRHVVELKPEICSLDVATMNSGGVRDDTVMINTPAHLRIMAEAIREAGVKPELELFDVGHVMHANDMIARGEILSPAFFQLCLGIQWGAPATPAALNYMTGLLPAGAIWSAFGIGPEEYRIAAQCVLMGGHVRVGLEDNLYMSRGVLAPSNAALVEKAVGLIDTLGESIASPQEAREILSL